MKENEKFSCTIWNETGVSTITISIQHSTKNVTQRNQARERIKSNLYIGKK